MNPITGMPLNIVSPPPLGAKSSSPMDVASANIATSNAKMSSLLNVTGGGKHYRKHNRKHYRKHNTFKGGAAAPIVVQPLHVPYTGGDALHGINTQMTSISAQNMANSKYDNDWVKSGVKSGGKRSGSNKRSGKRSGSNKRSGKRRRTNKRSTRRYKKM